MTRHKKHDDILDVQIRTKILDEYGNPIQGAIEYDPSTGFGKRIKDPTLGLVEDFYCKDGSVELDGHNFDDTNHDEDEVNSIREMITLKVSRNDPAYHDMLQAKVNQKRDEKQKPTAITASPPPSTLPTFIATTQIAKGEEIIIDLTTGQAKGTRSDNIHRPDEASSKSMKEDGTAST
jgi:hypothetical protein